MSTIEAAPHAPLPTPDDRPRSDVVIYDGHCRFCRGQVEALNRWDKSKRLSFLSLHDAEVARRYPDLTHEAMMRDMYVVDQQGRRHRGAAGVRYLSRHIPRLYPLAPVMHLPFTLPIWQFFYRMFAKRRYRFGRIESCDNGSCQIHPK